jgi:plastocyanin domain-containing protein
MSRRTWMPLAGLVFVVPMLAGLSGCSKSQADTKQDPAATSVAAKNANGSYAITANDKGFTPSSVSVKKGEKAELVFTRTTDATCATEVVFPEINLRKDLPLNKPVAISVPTDTARTLSFQCGMGMFKSAVVIN